MKQGQARSLEAQERRFALALLGPALAVLLLTTTAPLIYLRLRRDDYDDEALDAWAERVRPFVEAGDDVILVRTFTEADDVAGFHAAKGILTSEGGKASHAALVARGMGRPAVTGAAELEIDLRNVMVSAADSHARTLGRVVSHAFATARAGRESMIARALMTGTAVAAPPAWVTDPGWARAIDHFLSDADELLDVTVVDEVNVVGEALVPHRRPPPTPPSGPRSIT